MTDRLLLKINLQRRIIPEERLKEAQTIQEAERASGGTPRPLIDILKTQGAIDSITEHQIRILMSRSMDAAQAATAELTPPAGMRGGGRDGTEATGSFRALMENSLAPDPEVDTPPPSKSGGPQEVLDAQVDSKNGFGPFVLVAIVGSGGSGTVYRAWDRRVNRYAGLKILHTTEPNALERFTREAKIAGNLQHPAIATIYEVGEHEGRSYIAMKYIDGRPIDAVPRTIPENLALVRDACRALEYAHEQGIIHRDIKPANILVDEGGQVYLTDFGIAKQIHHDQTSTLSMTGTILGTPKYLPPEQARGEAKLADARSDVYSMGATLYTLLAGRAPFPSSNVWETIESVMKHDPPPLMSLNRAVSPELQRTVRRAMSKDPKDRYATAKDFGDELDRLLVQKRYSGRYGLVRYLARRWTPIAVAGVLLALLMHTTLPEKLFSNAKGPRESTDEELYGTASMALRGIEVDHNILSKESCTKKVEMQVDPPLMRLLAGRPNHLAGRVLQARAAYVVGDIQKAKRLLADPTLDRTRDYRIDFLNALMALEQDLADPPPLPAPEAPHPTWDGSLPALSRDWKKSLEDVLRTPEEPLIREEYRSDESAARGIIHLINGDWPAAFAALQGSFREHKLPVLLAARRRAAYMSGRFEDLAKEMDVPGTREELGHALGIAFKSDRPEEQLEKVKLLCAGDTRTGLVVHAWAARRMVDLGRDPRAAVAEGLALPSVSGPLSGELRGVLALARLRWLALAGEDTEQEYRKALEQVGTEPASWMGRLAAVEGLVYLGANLKLRGKAYEPALKEAEKFAGRLRQIPKSEDWKVPLLWLALAHMHLGRLEDAGDDLLKASGSSTDVRADLVSAALLLRVARQNRIKRLDTDWPLRGAREAAFRILGKFEGHPEALLLMGAAAEEKAELTGEVEARRAGLVEAIKCLSRAIEKISDYVEARLYRASASFLLGNLAPPTDPEWKSSMESALADLNMVLSKVPKLGPALALRGTVLCRLGRYDDALKDLTAARDSGAGVDPEHLEKWINRAKTGKGQKK